MNARVALIVCLAIGIAGLTTAGVLGYRLVSASTAALDAARQKALTDAEQAAMEISRLIRAQSELAKQTASAMEEEPADRATTLQLLAPIAASLQAEGNVGVALSPSAGGRRFAIQLTGDRNGARETPVADDYPTLPWFQRAMSGEEGWQKPVVETPGRGPIYRYLVPFSRPEGGPSPVGVLWISGEFEGADGILNVFQSGPFGWGLLLARNGDVLVHPDARLVRQQANALEMMRERGDAELMDRVKRVLAGEDILLEATSDFTGEETWFAAHPIPETGWIVVVVRLVDEILPKGVEFRQQLIAIVASAMLGLAAMLVWAGVSLFRKTEKEYWLWAAVAICSIVIVASIGVVRRVTFEQVSEEDIPSSQIQDANALASLIRSEQEKQPGLNTLPTGIYIKSVKFEGPRETLITGYIWQKFPLDSPTPEEPQFVLPDAYEPGFDQAYVRDEENYRVVGWSFESVIRQQLDASRYPFDHDLLSIRLWPPQFADNLLLVPDLGAYPLTNPASLPGLKDNLEVTGWNVSGSFFDYQFREYSTDFGLSAREGRDAGPQLRFNISVKRSLLDPSIQNFVPLVVILVMLFAVLVTSTSDVEESKLLGFNPSGTMRITSALFFVTLVAHIQLRNTLQTQEIVFLEYAYFTVYLTLLMTALHRFLFLVGQMQSTIIQYRDSLILKLLFWPVILGIQFVLTVILFY